MQSEILKGLALKHRGINLFAVMCAVWVTTSHVIGDELIYRYEGDMAPGDRSADWLVIDECGGTCSEAIAKGHFSLAWVEPSDLAYYHLWIARSGEPAPVSLWVEWRFRSNHPLARIFHEKQMTGA